MHIREGNWEAARKAIDCAEFADKYNWVNGDEDVGVAQILSPRFASLIEARTGIIWMSDLTDISRSELVDTKGIGKYFADEIVAELRIAGYKLKR